MGTWQGAEVPRTEIRVRFRQLSICMIGWFRYEDTEAAAVCMRDTTWRRMGPINGVVVVQKEVKLSLIRSPAPAILSAAHRPVPPAAIVINSLDDAQARPDVPTRLSTCIRR